ncbi:ABC transporter ATP-binding protein [Mesobacillus subterraneus]|uniref:ABC transporter ATP-binding protein n=1 Tax=Mesobacillus subterraneus TaxID=285983 RepID=A0A3R9FI18_9BACI|nr:ABC transporter ATP-binding protein [Mesobacillus subterraneus]RSD28503.1 ABC transporter ATP-binding protein [Mesobacillus subterraneus]
MDVIKTTSLRKEFGKQAVVNGIDLTVKQGEIYGFLGRNGAGKSTFINMLTGIILPSGGEFSLFSEKALTPEIRRKVGVLPDYSTFYDHLTAIQHLRFFSSLCGVKAGKKHCLETLDKVGMKEQANKKVGKFSFGMKKKLGIAQSVVHNPELIFLDEPTSGVDAESAIQIQELIRELNRGGMTIFMTSHNLHEVEKICTRIAIMKKGRITHEGTMDELRKMHNSTMNIKLVHSPLASPKKEKSYAFLSKFSHNILIGPTETSVEVGTEDSIPIIIRGLSELGIDLFRVTADQPSLEEIFLEKKGSPQTADKMHA